MQAKHQHINQIQKPFKMIFKMKPKVFLFLVFTAASAAAFAQVGINNDDPDTSAILDVKADKRGVLLPRITGGVDGITRHADGSVPDGLLFYNENDHKFNYYDTSNSWQVVNPWNQSVGSNTVSSPNPVEVNNSLNIRNGNATVTPPYKFVGFGTIPVGGIIMWSGDPSTNFTPSGIGIGDLDGWVLCNGNSGSPDLQGKFIVGYDRGNAQYNNIGNTGGEDSVTLIRDQIPAHNHSAGTLSTTRSGGHKHTTRVNYKIIGDGNGGDDFNALEAKQVENTDNGLITGYPANTNSGEHDHSITGATSYNHGELKGNPHENRPPYYVIAFIMRIR